MILVYEDERSEVFLVDDPLVAGQVRVLPKEGYLNAIDVPPEMISHFFYVASFAATTLFEGLGAEATNIIMNEGKNSPSGRFSIDVVPRRSEDSIDFKWDPKKLSQEELEEIKKKIAWEFIPPEQRKQQAETQVVPKPPENEEGDEDYYLKYYQKIP